MKTLSGIIIPAVTPFDESGALSIHMLKSNYERWNKTDVSGIMVLGSNGEFRSLSDDESFDVIMTASKIISKEKTLIAGIGRESLFQTLSFLNRLQEANAKIDYVSVLTPGYFKGLMTDEALIDYYTAIANESKYPVLLYCAPTFANGVCISCEAVKKLADHPNIFGIKDTSKDMMSSYMDTVGGRKDFVVVSGSLASFLTCLERGGSGAIVSAANYFPNTCVTLYEIAQQKGLDAAYKYYEELKDLLSKTGARASVASVKATMNLAGYSAGIPRAPVAPCSKELVEEMSNILLEYKQFLGKDIG